MADFPAPFLASPRCTSRRNSVLRRTLGASLPSAVFITGVLFFALSVMGWAKEEIDFSNADVPLYEQITNRIKDKVAARLGEGRNPRDRFFIIPFAYENKGNKAKSSHSFMSVIRVFADGRQPKVTGGLKARAYKNREFVAFTISWLPHDYMERRHLCLFHGFGARLVPSWNKCQPVVGKDFDLADTLKLAVDAKLAVGMWGPYEITKAGFDLAVGRLKLLESGTIKYLADDRCSRKTLVAINCFHAMAGIHELFPDGGIFGSGFKMWGLNGTERVLLEYTTKASNKGLLLEPVDLKKDLHGFVYAPDQSGRGIYNPFHTASAYRK